MDQPTASKKWREVLRAQGRTIRWLARETGRPERTLYGYSTGDRRPTAAWLAKASEVLGEEVTA